MKLFLFSKFKNPIVVDKIKSILPYLDIDYNINGNECKDYDSNPALKDIYETNAKLFYVQDEISNIDHILKQLEILGFKVEYRKVPYNYTQLTIKKILISTQKDKCPECNSDIDVVITKDIQEKISYIKYQNDRVILKYIN